MACGDPQCKLHGVLEPCPRCLAGDTSPSRPEPFRLPPEPLPPPPNPRDENEALAAKWLDEMTDVRRHDGVNYETLGGFIGCIKSEQLGMIPTPNEEINDTRESLRAILVKLGCKSPEDHGAEASGDLYSDIECLRQLVEKCLA